MHDLDKLSLDDSKKEWRKRAFERKLENMYGTKILNDINIIYDNKLNNIAECNLLYYILNPSKCTKNK